MIKEYIVQWSGNMKIEADSLEEAIDKIRELNDSSVMLICTTFTGKELKNDIMVQKLAQ